MESQTPFFHGTITPSGMQAAQLQRRHSCAGDEQGPKEFLCPPLKRFALRRLSPSIFAMCFQVEDKLFQGLILMQGTKAPFPMAPVRLLFLHGGRLWMDEQGQDGNGSRIPDLAGKPWNQ